MEIEQVEQEARALGWVPQEEFKGNSERWIDAEAFVERGKHIMPILQKNNEKLQAQLREESAARQRLEKLVEASQESLAAMEEHFSAATKKQVEQARQNLLAELKAAKAAGDVDAEVQITDELTQINAASKEEKKEVKAEAKQVQQDLPEVKAFKDANPWYGTDLKKTVAFNRAAEDLRLEGNTSVGSTFLDAVMRRYESSGRSTTSKVEGGSTGGNGSTSGGGKRFSDLPAEAKKACHDDAKRLVGEGRRFKTLADWENRYVELFFGDEQ